MCPSAPETKRTVRQYLADLRSTLTAAERAAASQQIVHSLRTLPELRSAGVIGIYVPVGAEVDIWPLIAAWPERRFLLPYVSDERTMGYREYLPGRPLIRGGTGIPEPEAAAPEWPPSAIAALVIPGLGFDRDGNRMGSGRGYFDRFLADCAAVRIGVAFACQIVPRLPHDRYDIPMDVVVTEHETINGLRRQEPA